MAKTGHNFAFSMLKGAPPLKKYTTAGRGGCDKYEARPKRIYTSAARDSPDKFHVWYNFQRNKKASP